MNDIILKKNKLFYNIDNEGLVKMLHCAKALNKFYYKDELICSQGDQPRFIYVLLKGRVAIVRNLSSGKKNILYEVDENNIFGEHYFFGDYNKYWYDIEAITDVEVLEIAWDFFSCFCNEACEHHRQLIKNMMKILCEKEWLAIKKLNIISHSSLQDRIFSWLLDNVNEDGYVITKMKREEMAAFFGVARPSLSRTLMKLQEEGVIEVYRDYFRILDMDRITSIL